MEERGEDRQAELGADAVDPAAARMSDRVPAPEAPPPFPSLPARIIGVFFSPGALMDRLAREPRWAAAMLVGVALVTLATTLIPVDVYIEMNREAALARGAEFPEMGEQGRTMMRFVIPLGSLIMTSLIIGLMAGVYTVVFAFVLGDEGRFVQYLAVLGHAFIIPALFGLLLTPLRISAGDPQLTLNLASFAFFLPDGYFLNVLKIFDLTQIWSTLVIARGVHAIDRRRSFGSAAAILLVIFSAMALVFARFMP